MPEREYSEMPWEQPCLIPLQLNPILYRVWPLLRQTLDNSWAHPSHESHGHFTTTSNLQNSTISQLKVSWGKLAFKAFFKSVVWMEQSAILLPLEIRYAASQQRKGPFLEPTKVTISGDQSEALLHLRLGQACLVAIVVPRDPLRKNGMNIMIILSLRKVEARFMPATCCRLSCYQRKDQIFARFQEGRWKPRKSPAQYKLVWNRK